MKKILLLLTLLMTSTVCAAAQSNPATSVLSSVSPAASNFLQQDEFLPIKQAYQLHPVVNGDKLELNWTLAPGYYLYQHRFKFFANGKPLELQPDYPPGTKKYDDYFQQELEVYYQQLSFELPLAGLLASEISVESQACADAGLCYPPRRQQIAIDEGVATLVENHTSSKQADQNTPQLALILLMALAGGAILNLMPCVFPVLSIKVLSLTRSGQNRHSRLLHGLAYSLGTVATFTAIAGVLVSLRATGMAVGWGFQLQSPAFVAGLAYLFALMALSFSGLFTLGGRWLSVSQQPSSDNNHRLHNSFLTGALATVVASPCTAPLMGTALGVALTQPAAIALLIFACLGLGMALPFLVLSCWPSLIERLPRPGPWMERFRQFLAFPLYLSAIWLLWILGRQTSVDAVATVLVSMTFIALAFWLAQGGKGITPLKGALLLALLSFAVYLPVNHFQQQAISVEQPSRWQPYTASRLQALRDSGRPVFVNLTADWCLTCLANERLALSSTRFYDALAAGKIAYLKGDWTNYNPEITELLNQNRRNGVPLYLLYHSDGRTELLPQLLTENIVIDALMSAR